MIKSDFGVIGLGVMGKSISLNVSENGFPISVYNREFPGEEYVVEDFLKTNHSFTNIQGFTELKSFIDSQKTPRKIFLMIKAGDAIDQMIDQLLPFLSKGDIIIDGGNSHYLDTKKRFDFLSSKGINFIGCGVSGGEEGARSGPSMMPGGTKESYNQVSQILETIAAKDSNGKPCCTFVGPEGSGHFVKMVHNGIEYAEMQLLTELYALLSTTLNYQEIAQYFLEWNKGELESFLLEITANILQKKEGNDYLLDKILDKAQNKGTGSWSSIAALNLGYPNTIMSSAVFARYISSFKEKRVVYSNQTKKLSDEKLSIDIESIKKAYQFARIINHQQGFALIKQATDVYEWNLNLSELARIWTNGCIIRSALMNDLSSLFTKNEDIIDDSKTFKFLNQFENDVSKTIQNAFSKRIALDSFCSAYNYWISMTSNKLPANLIQAQRDYFGAHTYQRIDKDSNEYFHTNWKVK
ncbi:NADP-dependent phosphogluconate dehydrogenase [Yeosuana sp. MJ-SS3]|uniref:6-phosphogluconate dehydrogenase, decarboxylating n=1 Tax=Gilvirhabdus luticola TaxID=3079858 RepID=A0ABU3U9H3_9FLAO|nr:NADP-dependent phosphogluconate dehydrogenase [Yeosuana sp. MJ-SS3]MDU8887062.1 NADP-dependent phosphogluconate dehydrogenase [Yeosuana sp. MJ-SS3]